jgi:cation:H+ antiporter
VTFLLLVLGIGVILLGSYLFTNGVEWLGKRLKLSEGVVGSVLAGVGTAMPETVIPILAILFEEGEASHAVGIGAILGAPFMLSCLTLPLLGMGLLLLARLGRRSTRFHLNYPLVQTDLRFFLTAYSLAILMAMLPLHGTGRKVIHLIIAGVLVVLYGLYLRRMLASTETIGDDVGPLILARKSSHPSLFMIVAQVGLGLGVIIGGAEFFIFSVKEIALSAGVSPLILSLFITPVATELPEKLNSLLWIYQRKDTLAVANITGAMVFQGTFPVSVGLIGTSWELSRFGLTSALLAMASTALLYAMITFRREWRPSYVSAGVIFYLVYGLSVIFL